MPASVRYVNPSKGELEVYGTLVFLASFDLRHKHRTARQMEDAFLRPAKLGLTRIWRDGSGAPAAAMTFAYLDSPREALLQEGRALVSDEDWMSGNNLWVIDFLSPFTNARKLLLHFAKKGTGGRVFSYLRHDLDGNVRHHSTCAPDGAGVFRLKRQTVQSSK
ncbi:MAG: toxin-activating lysine-acyltransferase [Pseudomonadota bacterium]